MTYIAAALELQLGLVALHSDWENRGFTGGETMILKPHVLDYWRSFQPGVGLEEKHFIDTVEPHFNRLTVFDPRFPHGVRPVAGTRDPLKGRLVRSQNIIPDTTIHQAV